MLELSQQNNTNGTCANDVEKIIIWLAKNAVNKITEIMTCSKSTGNASGSCKQTTPTVYADDTGRSLCSRNICND